MPLLNLAELLAPVSDEAPTGENLEYAGVAELERLATGNPGVLDPKTRELFGAEEPEWRKVKEACLALFAKTKDLRVAVILSRAMLSLHGLAGFGEGMALVHGLLSQYWDGVYPPLDKDEGDDPIERLNVLANLSDADGLLRSLRAARIAESREVGQFTSRDLDLASGRLPVPEGVDAPTQALLAAAWTTGDPELNSARQRGVEAALQAVEDIEKLFRDKTGDAPSVAGLRTALGRVKGFYDEVAPGAPATADSMVDMAESTSAKGAFRTVGTGVNASGPLASRADAINLLQKIAEFVRKAEPSSPAPMFIDRAVKVLQLDFAAIVLELMPDSKDRIEMLGGMSLDS